MLSCCDLFVMRPVARATLGQTALRAAACVVYALSALSIHNGTAARCRTTGPCCFRLVAAGTRKHAGRLVAIWELVAYVAPGPSAILIVQTPVQLQVARRAWLVCGDCFSKPK